MTTGPSAAVEVFYSYAPEDEALRDELEKHLSSLQRQDIITQWHNRRITAGEEWTHVLDAHLSTASIILLLISPDFMASDYCYGIEMQRALERHKAKEAKVIPILLRPVHWQDSPFGTLQVLPKNNRPVSRWRNRDDAFLDIVAGVYAAIRERNAPSPKLLPSSLPQFWNIPFLRNPFFTGRDDLLQQLFASLQAGQATALTQPHAINGLGGVGKTQIAVEYAYRFHRFYQAVFWAQAETHEALVSSFVAIAGLLDLPEKDLQDQTKAVAAILQWMKVHTSWLLILDNCDDLGIAKAFMPPLFGGQVLLTTRTQTLGHVARSIEVETMTTETGILFLLRRSRLITSDVPLERVNSAEYQIAVKIVQELGGLPLAIDQAGAYVESTRCRLVDYLHLYQTRRSALLKRRGELVADHPEPVATTWSISFDRLEQANQTAAELLRFCAFLYPDMIPEEIAIKGIFSSSTQAQLATADPLLFNDALATLHTYSLIKRDGLNRALSVHRLVQAVLKDEMDAEMHRFWAERAVQTVNEIFPDVIFETWGQCERYLTNAQVCITLLESEAMRFPEAANLIYKVGWYLKERGQYTEAEPLLRQALALRERSLGANHPDTAMNLDSLGNLFFGQGKYIQAEQFYLQALAIREKCLEVEHPDIAMNLNHLGWLYYEQGRYAESENAYVRALRIFEQRSEPEHLDAMTCTTNLAWLYYEQGRYAKAELLYLHALDVQERNLGGEHPSTATTMNNLALLYGRQGRYAEAEPLQRQAVAVWEQLLGAEHPETVLGQSNLGVLYERQGRYAEAEPLYTRALAFREQHLGPTHLHTAKSLSNLSRLYFAQGKYIEAELSRIRGLTILGQQLGPEHPDIARGLVGLARIYAAQEKYTEAELSYSQALATLEQQLGPKHPETAWCLLNMARLYDTQGKDEQVEAFYTRALSIYEEYFGRKHPDTISTLKSYVSFLKKINKQAEAQQIEEQIPPLSLGS